MNQTSTPQNQASRHTPAHLRNPRRGFLLALISTATLSANFVTVKYAIAGFDPWTLSVFWMAAATFYSFLLLCFLGKAKTLLLPRRTIPILLLLGLATAVGMLTGWWSLVFLQPEYAAFLARSMPLMLIVFGAVLLSEKLPRGIIFPALLMIVGGFISAFGQWHIVAFGTFLALVGCCALALQMVIAKTTVHRVHPYAIAFYRVFLGCLILLLPALLLGKLDISHAQPKHWAVLLLGAFLGPCLSHFVLFRAYQCWELSMVSIVRTFQPLFVIPMAFLVFGRGPGTMELIGGAIILAGGVWLAWITKNAGNNNRQTPDIPPA